MGRCGLRAERNVDHGRDPRQALLASDLRPPRDFEGYGRAPPYARWPGDARIAVNFNLNVEAGGERSILDGDPVSEDVLTDIGYPSLEAQRSLLVESVFEYGPRVGSWRLLRIPSTSGSAFSA